jgi:hypothetical protein
MSITVQAFNFLAEPQPGNNEESNQSNKFGSSLSLQPNE